MPNKQERIYTIFGEILYLRTLVMFILSGVFSEPLNLDFEQFALDEMDVGHGIMC